MYGLTLTPEVVWNIIPWSWLIDWFTNVGDVIANVDNGIAENLVAKYAYIMGETRYEWVATSTFNCITGGTHAMSHVSNLERKKRGAAEPFGFGMTKDLLSKRQVSILGALGLSRL